MTIFNKKVKQRVQDSKFVGAHLPSQLYSYLSLYTLATGESKNQIIVDVLENWKLDGDVDEDKEMKLIEECAQIAFSDFKNKKKANFQWFLNEVEYELTKKGITKEVISVIIEKIKNEKNKKS